MRQILLSSLAVAIHLIHVGCGKNGGSTPANGNTAPKHLISYIVTGISGIADDTTFITYNADSSVHTATNVIARNTLSTYNYTPGLVKIIHTLSGSVVRVDSIVLNAQGDRSASYILHPGGSQYDAIQQFTYNSAGELTQLTTTEPGMPGSVPNTTTMVWQNGDVVSQTSTNGKGNLSYSYDAGTPIQAGDIQYSNFRLAFGPKHPLNAHLCTKITDASNGTVTINYSWDSKGRLSGYQAMAGGNMVNSAIYAYVP